MPRLADRLRRGIETVAAIVFAAMFAAFILQVFTRYVLNDPTAWTQEATLVCYLWVVFWCAAFMLRERDQITFDMLVTISPRRVQRVLAAVSALLVAVAFAVALPGTIDWIRFMKFEKTPVMGLRYDWLYSIFIVFCVAVVVRAGLRARELLSSRWERTLDEPPSSLPE